MQVCFFEDALATRFHPLTLTRPVDNLRTGILTIGDKWLETLQPKTWSRLTRPELTDLFSRPQLNYEKTCLWINSRMLPTESLINQITDLKPNTYLATDDAIVAARSSPATTDTCLKNGTLDVSSLTEINIQREVSSISNLWDLFVINEQEIKADISRIGPSPISKADVSADVILENPDDIYTGNNVTIEPGTILTARQGPIFIGTDSVIQAGAIVRGPAAICHNSTAKMASKICKGSTIGPVCKVNGEINNSIIHSYSNKAHEGYLGNSLIGQWCNLGANTSVSNLKNNYSSIRITDWESHDKIDTGRQFFGTVMGDHSKTAINTHLNTGTLCGVSCNIFSGDFPPTFIPSFSWVGTDKIQPYRLSKALETMEHMMNRRDVSLTKAYSELMRHIFEGRSDASV